MRLFFSILIAVFAALLGFVGFWYTIAGLISLFSDSGFFPSNREMLIVGIVLLVGSAGLWRGFAKRIIGSSFAAGEERP